ncbi:MAG TPA: MATE family efflux transporter [Candidatus Faecousia intestinigallinarum]|nr:MATE family efflux transporter [Candidatus Faecousia intestinigallinarum]
MDTQSTALIEGTIWKKITLFALPILLGNVFQQFYNAFDSWAVGVFIGDDALAAVSSSGSLIFMMIGFFNGVAMGAGVIIARYFGAKDYEAMSRAVHTDVAFGITAGVLLSVLGVAFTPTILKWMDTPANVLPQSIDYFRYYFYGGLFVVLYNIFVGILIAVGDSRHPLYYLIFASLVNVVLDTVFLGVFHLGVGSAAVATAISQGISALLCFLQLLRTKEPYKLELRKIRYHWDSFRQIIRYGLPSGVQNSVIALANVVVQSNINSFGSAAMAGCGSYSRLEGFAFLPITCFTQALSTFVGQNLGAKKYDRVKKGVRFGIGCSMILAELIGIVAWIFAPQLIGIFSNETVSIDFGVQHMRTICLFYCLLAFSHCIAAILRGAGRATVPMFVMLGCWCVLRVSYITIAVRVVNELVTVSRAYPITWAASSIIFLIYFLKADWMHTFERHAEQKTRSRLRNFRKQRISRS